MSTVRLENVTHTFRSSKRPLHKADAPVEDVATAATASADGVIVALDNVSFTLPDGKTLVVLGPSGCGKSTLLRVVCGLESNYSGHVYYDDQRVDEIPPKDRHIGMVFQNYALYPHFEGHGNLSFFFKMRRTTDAETEERIRITSDIMGIGFRQLLARKPGTLSGGQQQRLAIARAIVRKPDLFLFDEPLSNLDAKLRSQTRIEIKRLLRQFRITAVYVTHDQVEAMALGDLVAIMRNGCVEQMGTFTELMTSPVNTFVAGFVGTPPMNLFENGRVDGGRIAWGEDSFKLPAAQEARFHVGQSITIGVRPESAVVGEEMSDLREGLLLRGEVQVIEPDFARQQRLIYLREGGVKFTAQSALGEPLNVGNQIQVKFPIESLIFFDGESGKRLF